MSTSSIKQIWGFIDKGIDKKTKFSIHTQFCGQKIVLPLSTAILAVIGLYYFVGHWNDYFTGLIYVNEQDKLPLQNVLQQILLANQTNQMGQDSALSGVEAQQFADQIKYGVIIVATLPLLVIYPLLQKYFEKGVMIGAVKG